MSDASAVINDASVAINDASVAINDASVAMNDASVAMNDANVIASDAALHQAHTVRDSQPLLPFLVLLFVGSGCAALIY